ncbi:MAG TPA: bifunctional pyr operon transcriptional regulator/uracil phosphoribosyltransferase PyrR [Chthoniobacterales bacterium]|jgi:pyrimidine operon attenuation protein/uracil phosphoribosyltransferase
MKQKTPNENSAVRIFDVDTLGRTLRRMAHEIIERNQDLGSLILAGIPARGVELAQRIAAEIKTIKKVSVASGVIDVSMHRDDLGKRGALPVVRPSQLPLPLEGKTVVIVDDVIFTGRTCRAALDAIRSFGRPDRIQLAVLIDRGHRELPIRPDFVGKNLPTAQGERVRVRLKETNSEADAVWLEKE